MSKQWEYCDKYVFSGVDLSTNPHTFNNLQGDKYDYRLVSAIDNHGTSGFIRMRFNGDTGTNYRWYRMYGVSTTPVASVDDSNDFVYIVFLGTNTSIRSFSTLDILGTSDVERSIDLTHASYYDAAPYIHKSSYFWKNTSDELTSIELYSNVTDATTGEFYLFRRQKESVYNAADWELIEEKNVSAVDISSNPIVFNNLQGDTDEEYLMELQSIEAAGNVTPEIIFNGDTGSNYTYQTLRNYQGNLTATTGTTTYIVNWDFDSTHQADLRFLIKAKSGAQRSCHILETQSRQVQVPQINWWTNTADELNSITISSSESPAVTMKALLYKRSKKRSTPAHEKLIADYDISGDFSSGYTFKNLDTNKMYRIELTGLADSTDEDFEVILNGDTGTNYTYQFMYALTTTTGAGTSTAFTNLLLSGVCDTTNPHYTEMLLFPKTGKHRPCLNFTGQNNSGIQILLTAMWWQNTADDLESIKVFTTSSDTIEGNIKIWEIDLP